MKYSFMRWKPPPEHAVGRLSYFLWGAPPDTELYAAAEGGRLADKAEVARQADRLLMDARAQAGLGHFFEQLYYLDIIAKQSKDGKLYPVPAHPAGWHPPGESAAIAPS